MAFPPGFLDELRSRVPLTALIGRRVKLERRGREQAGLCPFHHEKTPSFYVVEDKSFFHCFGCGAHGDAIGFLMRADNLDFLEAVEKLAAEAGLAVPQATPQERERAQRQKTLIEALAAAAGFYEKSLWAPEGRPARDYLKSRGLDDETIRHFRLGWASSDRHALCRALSREFPLPLLVSAGLARQPQEGSSYDYFRGRVIFPIADRAGRVIAFGGRVIGGAGDEGQPKYLNSPETEFFEKGRILYGWSQARAAARLAGEANIIVGEGYMDVIALYRAGFATAVAPLGTALTETQLQELWRLAAEPVLCFDGDAAGERAAARALRRALPLLRPGQSLRFAALPAGEDPDSLIRAGGRAAFEEVLKAARPLSRVLWELELGARPLDTPERRADLDRRLNEDLGLIADRPVQAEYRRYFRERLYEAARPPSPRRPAAARRLGREPPATPPVEDRGRPTRSPQRVQREILLRMLLQFPELIEEVAEEFAALDLPEPELDRLRHQILETEALRPGLDARSLQQHLVQSGFAETTQRLVTPSLDAGFLIRRNDRSSVRNEWAHVVSMLKGGDRSSLAEIASDLASELSPERWERFLAARERALTEPSIGDEEC